MLNDVSFLSSLTMFTQLTPDETRQVAQICQPRKCERFGFIFMPDEAAKELFILRKGRVKIGAFAADGREIIKEILRPGAIFGDLALSGESHRSEFAQVMQDDAEVLCIKIDDFQQMMQTNQNLTFCVMKHFTQRLHRAEERLAKLMVKDARERIIEFLMEAADHDGRRVGFETLVKHQMTQQDIANLTGTSRQTVTSVFNDLKRSNLIHFNRNSVLIRDMEKLA